jgi:hypothetical protein
MSELAIPEILTLLRDPSTCPAQSPCQGLVMANLPRVDYVVPNVTIGYTFSANDLGQSCHQEELAKLQPLIQMEVRLHG